MSNFGKFRDRNPGLRPAGVVVTIPEESTKLCVQPAPPRESTPEKIKKFRKSFNEEPGLKQIHYGIIDDPLPAPTFTYGKKTYKSDHVNEIIAPMKAKSLAQYEVQLIFPVNGVREERPEVREQYYKSHGVTEAGQQMSRNYKWPVDKTQHRFGKPEPPELHGVAMALHPESFASSHPKTEIIKKTVEDFRNVTHEELGKSKNLGTGRLAAEPDRIFGVPTYKEPWDAGQCIKGTPQQHELFPDKDLGKSNRFGFRNTVKTGDELRQFGVPTIRSDVEKKSFKSVADPNNYGDEASVVQLLYPDCWLRYGISENEFMRPREIDNIRSLFEAIGVSLGKGKALAMASKGQELYGVVSLESFLVGMRWFQDRGLN